MIRTHWKILARSTQKTPLVLIKMYGEVFARPTEVERQPKLNFEYLTNPKHR